MSHTTVTSHPLDTQPIDDARADTPPRHQPPGPPAPTGAPGPTRPPAAPRDTGRPGRIDHTKLPVPVSGSIHVAAWPDPYLATHGHDVRSSYVELFWLSVLGPSATMLLRRLASVLDQFPDGYRLPIADTARSLGLGVPTTRNSPFVRALHRCAIFRVVRFEGSQVQVRRQLPTLHQRQVDRLPTSLRVAHDRIAPRLGDAPGRGVERSGGATGQ